MRIKRYEAYTSLFLPQLAQLIVVSWLCVHSIKTVHSIKKKTQQLLKCKAEPNETVKRKEVPRISLRLLVTSNLAQRGMTLTEWRVKVFCIVLSVVCAWLIARVFFPLPFFFVIMRKRKPPAAALICPQGHNQGDLEFILSIYSWPLGKHSQCSICSNNFLNEDIKIQIKTHTFCTDTHTPSLWCCCKECKFLTENVA